MRGDLHDLRLLKMAQWQEEAHEGFLVGMTDRYVRDPEVRGKVLALAGPVARHHRRLAEEAGRIAGRLTEEEQAGLARAALLDVRDVEQERREFYLRHADDLRDPALARLFRDLARAEGRHVQVAEEALAMVAARPAGPGTGEDFAPHFQLLQAEAMPLREGVSDFGARHHPPPRRERARGVGKSGHP
jgi:hypothetical protein